MVIPLFLFLRTVADIQEFYELTLLDESKSVQQKTAETIRIADKWEASDGPITPTFAQNDVSTVISLFHSYAFICMHLAPFANRTANFSEKIGRRGASKPVINLNETQFRGAAKMNLRAHPFRYSETKLLQLKSRQCWRDDGK